MGFVDELIRAREDYERGDWARALDTWSGLDADEMDASDLRAAAASAYLLGRVAAAIDYYQRGFRLSNGTGDPAGAARCAFHLSMIHATAGEPSLAAGWTARAAQVVGGLDDDAVEQGYLAFLVMFQHLAERAWPTAAALAARATGLGRLHRDPDLLALGLCSMGRIDIYSGRVDDGLTALDEAMAVLTAGEVSPGVCGNVYCTAIEGCQEIAEFGRVAEWTSALHRWCAALPGLVTFTGQCSVHRGQVMRLRGAFAQALDEFEHAIERYRHADSLPAAGLAESERGDVLRVMGDYTAADAAYQRSAELGLDPQPGLALLWLATGRPEAAVGAVRRLLAEQTEPTAGCRLLPAAVEVLLAAGSVEEARTAATALDEVATRLGTSAVQAMAAYADGAVELAVGDAAGSLPYLRKAAQLWGRVDSPYEVARTRVLIGRALGTMGDGGSAETEFRTATATFAALGAAPAAAETERLLLPDTPPGGLTVREAQVLRLVAEGRSNAAIATELVLSEKTVARHLSNIFTKLDVGSRTAAAAYAFEHHLI
ncbi:LuxR family transcriptional regulator [Microlunatus sp. Gsoil 973]|uniref:LuxR family transcriptional regulator n=1 Tax=Microlunatus sp. Gsoil 973 TaxID=2672569 RepID=UPI0012B4CE82|nr:LuxR family transcriptional regulator [Microlunatus sp. Gsoil 973]QGN34347.1 helix-turn-helix transcriptional regulator [Microlunatus sp. Gsoil 973]